MKRFIQITGIFLSLVISTGVFAGECDIPAPDSCFQIKDNEKTQPLDYINLPNTCSEDGKQITLKQNVVDFLEKDDKKNYSTAIKATSVSDLQSFLKDHPYTKTVINDEKYCSEGQNSLNDGKYGNCTKLVFEEYLKAACDMEKEIENADKTFAMAEKNIDEVLVVGVKKYIKGKVKTIKSYILPGIKINSPEIDDLINKKLNLIDELKALKVAIEKSEKDEGCSTEGICIDGEEVIYTKEKTDELIEKYEEVYNDIGKNLFKGGEVEKGKGSDIGKYFFITDEKGEFYFSTYSFPEKEYNLIFSDGDKKYKTKSIITQNTGAEDKIDLGDIKLYSDCETGNSFDADCLFPAWATKTDNSEASREEIRGIYGVNNDGKIALSIIPKLIDIILKFISPIIVVMFIYSGVMFIYAGSDDEDLKKAKDIFLYTAIGMAFIIMSYTLMKIVYFFLQ